MFHDQIMCRKVVQTAIIMQNMIVESIRDRYESMQFEDAHEAIEKGLFIFNERNKIEFNWDTPENIDGAIEHQIV